MKQAPELRATHRNAWAHLGSLVTRAANATVALFNASERGGPSHVGCGVLLAINSSRFILTAAHVVDDLDPKGTLLMGEGAFVPFSGQIRYNALQDCQSRKEDTIDVAVILLAPQCNAIPGKTPLTIGDLNVRDWMQPAPNHMLLGFPESKTRVDAQLRTVKAGLVRLISGTVPASERTSTSGLSDREHVVIAADRSEVMGDFGPRTPPKFDGMSGCGLWSLRNDNDLRMAQDSRLVAVFTEVANRHRVAVGTRVFFHIELIRACWPHLSSELPDHHAGRLHIDP